MANPEWTDPGDWEKRPFADERQYWFSRSEVAGTLAMWAIRQSPYLIPVGLLDAVQAVHDALPDEIGGIFGMTEGELREKMLDIIFNEPAIIAWNEPKSGHTATTVFVSRYGGPAPDDDFIDLDALANNVCRSLLADQDDYERQPPCDSGSDPAGEAGTAECEASQSGGSEASASPNP